MDEDHYRRVQLAPLITIGIALLFSASVGEAKTIALGNNHTCAITTAGKVMCWGDNSSGQLGNGSNTTVTPYNTVATKLDPQDVPVSVTAGGKHTCALLKTGLVKCWGDNSSGQLGTGKFSPVESTPVSVVGLNSVKAIAAGLKHTCALYSWGYVKCWGNNQYGQLGNGKFPNSALPDDVLYIFGLVDLAVGDDHSCAISQDKSKNVYCWGGNNLGQLGNKSTTNSNSATFALVDKPALSVAAGGDRTCAIMADKTVQCWGWSSLTSIGSTMYSSAPQPVAGLSNVGSLAVGGKHMCVRDTSTPSQPKLKCWGNNTHAEIGLASGAVPGFVDTPTLTTIPSPVMDVAAGTDHTCAITTMNGVPVLRCWGNDTFGQLGIDPQGTYLKKDPSNPSIKFSPAPIVITTLQVSVTSAPLDTTPAPPPPPAACIYTYSAWSTCQLQSWGWAQGRIATSKTPASCVGEPVVSQSCVSPPAPPAKIAQAPGCPAGKLEWNYWWNGKLIPKCGCITENADKDAAGNRIPWMGDKFAMVYFSGGTYKVDWAYRKDNLPVYQGPWYYAASNGSVNNVPNGFASSSAITPINGFTMYADNQLWAAMQPKKVFVSGSKLGSTWKNCSAADLAKEVPLVVGGGKPGAGGGSPTISATEKYWSEQKATVDKLMTQLATAANTAVTTKAALQKETSDTLEPIIKAMFESKVKPPAPKVAVAVSLAAYTTAQQTLQATTKQLIDILTTAMKQDGDTPSNNKIRDVLSQVSLVFMNTLFTATLKVSLSDPTKPGCKWDPIDAQFLYKVVSQSDFIATVQCLPQTAVNMMDQNLATSFQYTIAAIQKFHPFYLQAIQDYLYGQTASKFITIYERTRFQGAYVPSRQFMQQYADRVKTLKPNTKAPMETGVNIIPDALMLYNPASKKAEAVNLVCPNMTSPDMVWNETSKCMVCPNFIKTLMDPTMNKEITCSFWDTARLGKPCLPTPPPEVGRVDISRNIGALIAQIQVWLMPSAFAEPAKTKKCTLIETGLEKEGGTVIGSTRCCETILCGSNFYNYEYCYDISCPCGWHVEIDPNSTMYYGCADDKYAKGKPVIVCVGGTYEEKLACIPPPPLSTCGNIKVEGSEECDDGNKTDTDACTNSCKNAKCGDKIILKDITDPKKPLFEECDDGNTKDGDGCSSDCKKTNCFEGCLNAAEKFDPATSYCPLYFGLLKDGNDPQCIMSSTPWDATDCKITPFKKGNPCWMALQYYFQECRQDKELMKCVSLCPVNEPTQGMLDECEKNPPPQPPYFPEWVFDFAPDAANAAFDAIVLITQTATPIDDFKKQGAGVYKDHWWALMSVLEKVLGGPLPPDLVESAYNYGLNRLAVATACEGDDLADLGKDNAIFFYTGVLCWNPNKIDSQNFKEEVAQVFAHEAMHAALFVIWKKLDMVKTMSPNSNYSSNYCGFGAYTGGGLDHWLQDYLAPLDILKGIKNPWYIQNTGSTLSKKSLFCTKKV